LISPLIPRDALHNAISRPVAAADPSLPFDACTRLRLHGKDAGERRYLLFDLSRIESEPVEGDQRGQAGEQSQQDGVGDSTSDEEEVLIRHLFPGAPDNILPSGRRYVPRIICLPPTFAVPDLC
jgi:hypothetical protein